MFHIDLLRLVSGDPLLGQQSDDSQPDPVLIESHEEYSVEEILYTRQKKRGKGRQVLMKWSGYYDLTWEPLEEFTDTIAIDDFELRYRDARIHDGPREKYERKKKTA